MGFPSAIDPAGILMLVSVRKVFELAELKPESIQFQKDVFNAANVIDALTKEPKKCPIIAAVKRYRSVFQNRIQEMWHAMVTNGALKGSEFLSQDFIICKNSYRNNPEIPDIIEIPLTFS